MSLRRFEKLPDNTMNLIIYTQSPTLEYFVKQKLKERFAIHKDFIVNVEKGKELNDAKLDSMVAPLMCDKWLIHVNVDKLTKKDLRGNIEKITSHGITVYWTHQYRKYKELTDMPIVKKQSVHYPSFALSRLSEGDIRYLHDELVPKKSKLDPKLMSFVMKGYRYDVQAVCDLFVSLRSGNEVRNRREIIELIGVGGNSIASLTIKVLTIQPEDDKKKQNALKRIIKLIDDLSVSYDYRSIRRFMLNNVNSFIEMKQLQIMGLYNRPNKEIPDAFNTKQLNYVRRFERTVLEEISLPQLLNLKMCLLKYNDFNAQIALVQAISEYINRIKVA